MKILQLTDTHLFADPAARLKGVDPRARLRAVVTHACAWHPEPALVLATGDLVHDETEAGYRLLRRELDRLGAPLRALPGNHDHPGRLARVFGAGAGAPWAGGRWRVLPLDGRVAGRDGGRWHRREARRLERLLAGWPARVHLLVATHHQPLPVGSPWIDAMGLAGGRNLLGRLALDGRARALVCGHVHQPFEARLAGIRILATPAVSVQFRPRTRDPRPEPGLPGYRWLRLGPDGAVETGIERVPPGAPLLRRIVSGGQSGVDRAALDVALALGLPAGGWCPAGRRAEDGPIPARYPLRETPSADYAQRTAWNVRDSDATLILHRGPLAGGTRLTRELAERHGRPCLCIDLAAVPDPAAVRRWLTAHGVGSLNVAGPRETQSPGIGAEAAAFLRRLLLDPDA
ncbi:YpsA SLOG family protein [Inmirania thermothiophila]|uniref:3',5'-cyclic AMP phosphodiesterase CpdA n=1 Tax=Inmirania thermothiophila TaxID=1750597 RepID=A0A3N1Y866_9GAMM|nr:putative molybdenum carrier protein [Inmirania thermothiophila]ROR35013.1 3',5'-cyclic AMP phosphodiesterase CpdA [Inmirania thermothiophila]